MSLKEPRAVFACICRAVTSDQVNAAIDDGAASLRDVARATRACTGCGICRERIAGMLADRAVARPLAPVGVEALTPLTVTQAA